MLFILCLSVLASCKTTKKNIVADTYIKTETDTERSRYQSLYYTLVDSIRNVPSPKEKSESRGLQRSELETSLSRSIAFLDSLGLLHHMIENKDSIPQTVRTITDRQYIHDTIYQKKDSVHFVDKEVYIEKEPSFWENIRRTVGDISIGLLILFFAIFIIKLVIKK